MRSLTGSFARSKNNPLGKIFSRPFLAIFEADAEALLTSKMVIGWLIVGLFFGTLIVIGNTTFTAAGNISTILGLFVLLWSFVIIGISAGAVSSESGIVADSLLSRPVKRYEYILAKVCGRCAVVMTCYLIISIFLSILAIRLCPIGSLDYWGWLRGIVMMGLLLLFLTSMGVMFSTLSGSTVISVILMLLVWWGMISGLAIARMDAGSPGYLMDHMRDIINGTWNDTLWQSAGIFLGMAFLFVVVAVLFFEEKDLGSD